jgi:hypothetical protein
MGIKWYQPRVYRLKITLLGSDPPIWRRVEVDNGTTLYELHVIIQIAFGWENCHLHHFCVTPNGKLTRRALTDGDYYAPKSFELEETKDSERVSLLEVLKTKGHIMLYTYDMGDSWDHAIKLEAIGEPGEPAKPGCLEGENAGPPEEIGGIWGFYERLKIAKDPSHPDHAELVEWLGDFDPQRFDLDEVNKLLDAAFEPAKPKRRKSRTSKKK